MVYECRGGKTPGAYDDEMGALGAGIFHTAFTPHDSLQLLRVSTMEAKSQLSQQTRDVISRFDGHITALSLTKEIARNAPAKAAFSSVIDILTTIRVSDLLAFSRVGHGLKYA